MLDSTKSVATAVRIVLVTIVLLASVDRANSQEPINILLVTFDDMNDWVGCLDGHPQVQTPHLDRLAARGVLFTNAHCASPVCSGSRAANFTGLLPIHNGVYGNSQKLERTLPNAILLPQDLASQGYHTMGTGKLLHGNSAHMLHEFGVKHKKFLPITEDEIKILQSEIDAPGPFVQHEIPRLGLTMPLNQMPRDRDPKSNRIDSFDWGPIDAPEEEWTDTMSTNWAIAKLRERHDQPFFLGLGIYRPHQPLWAPKKYHEMYPPDSVELPKVLDDDLNDVGKLARDFGRFPITSGAHKTVVENGQWRNAVSGYLACITFADAQLGRILDELDNSPYANNTMIVAWSDHGWQLGEKEHWGKFTPWQRSTRVPLIIVPPKSAQPTGFQPGSRCERVVSLIDVYPTIIDMLGLRIREDLDGKSLKPLIAAPKLEWDRVVTSTIGRGTHTVRDQRWHYTRYFDGSEELYDFQNDPNEWKNLAGNPNLSSIQSRLRNEIPNDSRFQQFARYGDFKVVVSAQGNIQVYGPGLEAIKESKDVSKRHPQIVAAVEKYLATHPGADKHIAIPVQQPIEQ